MKRQNGFASLILLFIFGAISIAAIGGYFALSNKEKSSQNIINKQIPTNLEKLPTLTPTPSVKPALKSLPSRIPITPTSATTKISVDISDDGITITDPSIYLFLRNEDSTQEQMINNTNSGHWTINNPKPGKYKMYVAYSYQKFGNIANKCEGCRNSQDIINPGSCGAIFDLNSGDNPHLSCTFRPVHPLSGGQVSNNRLSNDTMPPNTNIYYPQPNGTITYKIDGKVCAIATEPNDNSGPEGIVTEYKFDNENWSGYAGGRGYLCTSSLPNGPHTLSYHSKDWAGNVETTKTISFSVNIPGN